MFSSIREIYLSARCKIAVLAGHDFFLFNLRCGWNDCTRILRQWWQHNVQNGLHVQPGATFRVVQLPPYTLA